MNEIKKCSIASISFTLEKSAYEALQAYIKSLNDTYKDNPDGEEIIADIEARIAELILSAQPANAIIAKPLIDNIIKYAFDHMSLITAAILIKKKFTIEELTRNYYSSVDLFTGDWY